MLRRMSLRAAATAVALAAGAVSLSAATPALAETTHPHRYVATVGADDALWLWETGQGWRSLGGRITSAPTMTYGFRPDGSYTVLITASGADHNVWVRSLTSGWAPFGPKGTDCAGPGATSGSSQLTVACRGTDGGVWSARATIPQTGMPRATRWTGYGGRVVGGVHATFFQDRFGPVTSYLAVGTDGTAWRRTETGPWEKDPLGACAGELGGHWASYDATCADPASGELELYTPEARVEGLLPGVHVVGRPAVGTGELTGRIVAALGSDGAVHVGTWSWEGDKGAPEQLGGHGKRGVAVLELALP